MNIARRFRLQKKRRLSIKQRLFRRRVLWGIIIVAWFLFILFFSDYSLVTRLELEIKKRELEQRIQQLQQDRDSLIRLIERLQYDTVYIEKLAREQYGMIKPGERVYLLEVE